MPVFIDHTGRKIEVDRNPQRIISLVPSQTELLYDLGLDKEVVGITKFCVHPKEWFQAKTRIGGTKTAKMDLVHQLQPDLIIANKEENVKEQIEELAKQYPVWISDVNDLPGAYKMMKQVGKMTGKEIIADDLIARIKKNFTQLKILNAKLRTCYLIWKDPYMTVGGDTFIHSMIEIAGFENTFAQKKRYPEITIDDVMNAGCEVLLLPSEPFPFKQKHVDELKSLLPTIKIILVDGEMFSWYGSRMLYAAAYFKKLKTMISEK
ncbi:MAG: helical backbone metal receptor [Chitinophagaceae bacterium]